MCFNQFGRPGVDPEINRSGLMARQKLNFTKSAISSLPLPEPGKRVSYHDTKVPGLELRVTSNGVRSFYLYRKIDNRAERVFIGRFPGVTPDNARAKAAELNSQIAMGKNPAETKRKVRAEMTLAELFERYMTLHARPYKRSWRNDQNLYAVHLHKWGDRRISDISRKEVQHLHASIMVEHPHQANRVRSLLSTMFSKAIEWGYDGANPVVGVKKYKEQSRDRFIQQEELAAFFKAVMDDPSEMLRDFWLLSLFTGARQGNVQTMAWREINFERREWRIPQTKSGEALSVPLVNSAMDILVRRRAANTDNAPWVFPGTLPGKCIAPPIRAWARLIERAGLENLRPHDLRRTLGSWMSISGVPLHIVGAALGHKGFTTTHIYARLQQAPILEGMEAAVKIMLFHAGLLEQESNTIPFPIQQ